MATSSWLKTPVSRTNRSIASTSARSGRSRNISAAQRGANDVFDNGRIRKADLFARRRDARVGFQTGIGIDLEDERLSFRVDPEIHPRIACESDQRPAVFGQLFERAVQRGFTLAPMEMPHGA